LLITHVICEVIHIYYFCINQRTKVDDGEVKKEREKGAREEVEGLGYTVWGGYCPEW